MKGQPRCRFTGTHRLTDRPKQVADGQWWDGLDLAFNLVVGSGHVVGGMRRTARPQSEWDQQIFVQDTIEWMSHRQGHCFGRGGITDVAIGELIAKSGYRTNV